ncbi:autotransporter-associated beta strand repeat-containing protein [Verrucomicrobium sp. BvORR106]|uniref:beta strand repeat-containing protein n=1 Tax=Verrucomicrobium sp. BvORR106 TaxID=1403819 RepID=UPI002240EDA0|nr:autotransporter-associated beta strand repeat-containing protein [Verrucomicrobium sp. BvORR106]
MDFGSSNTGTSRLDATSTLALGGGAFRVLGTSQAGQTTSQTVASTTLNPGASTIEVVANGGNAASLALGGITRNKGATVNFILPASGAISTTQANASFSGGSQTILGGYATVGGNTWAVSGSGATAGVVTGLSTYSSTFTAGTDVDAPAGTSAPGVMTINSLRFNQAGGATVNTGGNLTIATGGILMTSTVTSAVSINNNNLTSGNGQDLIVHQHSTAANLTIASAITGSIGLTKSGAGNLVLTGTNTYTGGTYVNGGQLTITKAGALGTGVTVLNGGTLAVSTAAVDLANTYTMQIGANGGTLRHEGFRFYIRGVISDVAGQSGVLTITGNGTGDVVLDVANTYTGGTILAAGSTTLVLNNAAFGTGTVTFAGGNIRTGSAVATLANAINFAADTIIPVTGTQVLTFSGKVTLTGGNRVLTTNSAADTAFSGSIGEEGGSYSFTKAGSGRVVLTGTNTYSGGTILSGGTLNINSDANLGAVPSTAATNITFAGGTSLQTNYSTNVELAATRNILINSGVTGSFHAHGLASFFVVNGQISGAGNLGVVSSDGGILVLNGSNSYSGTTTLFGGANTGGYLRLGHASALGNTSLVTIGSGTTTELSRLELAIAGGATIDRNFSVYSRNNTSASFLNLNGANTLTGTFTSAGTGTTHTIQSDGGRLDLSFSSVSNTKDLVLQGAGDGSMNVSMFTTGSSATITKSGTGAWTVTAGQTTSGAVSITAGTYLANNASGSATGSGAVTVSGGTLGGTGRVQGNTTISSVYGLRPGDVNSTGKLTFGGDLTLAGSASPVTRLELQLGATGATTYNDAAGIANAMGLPGGLGDATTGYYATVLATYEAETGNHDRLDIAGVLKLDANGRITVSSLGYNPQFGDVFDLMDWVGTLNLDADASGGQGFNLLTDLELPTLADGMYWDTTLFASNGILVAVPEPGRAVLMMLGVVALFGRRRRRCAG